MTLSSNIDPHPPFSSHIPPIQYYTPATAIDYSSDTSDIEEFYTILELPSNMSTIEISQLSHNEYLLKGEGRLLKVVECDLIGSDLIFDYGEGGEGIMLFLYTICIYSINNSVLHTLFLA